MMNKSSDQANQLQNFTATFGSRFKYNPSYFEFFGKHVYYTKLNEAPYPELQMYY